MAFTAYQNIRGSDGIHVALLSPGDKASSLKSLTLCNVHVSADATVSLSIVKLSDSSSRNASETYYLIKNVSIRFGTTLHLDDPTLLAFNNLSTGYSLFITVGSGDQIDVVMTR